MKRKTLPFISLFVFIAILLTSCEEEESAQKDLFPLKGYEYLDGNLYSVATWEYDNQNRLIQQTAEYPDLGNIQTQYQYNSKGQVFKVINLMENEVSYIDSIVYYDNGNIKYIYQLAGTCNKKISNQQINNNILFPFKHSKHDLKGFIILSRSDFEYNSDGYISKKLVYYDQGEVEEYTTYQYDSNGNVVNMKAYFDKDIDGNFNTSVYDETTIEYDDKKHHLSSCNLPNLYGYTYTNNILEITYDWNGSDVESQTYLYEYNSNGYPVKITLDETHYFEVEYK